MTEIRTSEGSITLNHEWPVDIRVEAFTAGQPVVSLEVDTEYGTAVLAITLVDLAELADRADELVAYYEQIQEDEWNSR